MSAYFSFEGAAAVLFGLICVIFVVYRSLRNGKLSYLEWSLLFFALVHGLSAPPVAKAIVESPSEFVGSQFMVSQQGAFGLHTIAAILGVIGLVAGWKVVSVMIALRGEGATSRRQAGPGNWAQSRGIFARLKGNEPFIRAFWLMLGVGSLAQVLYSIDYGGLFGVFDYSRQLRSGLLLEEQRSRFSFLLPVAGFVMIACYGFAGVLLGKVSKHLKSAKLGFAVSLVFSLYVLYSWQGRLGIVSFFAILILALVLAKSPNPITLIALFFGAAIIGFFVVYQIADLWNVNPGQTFSRFYLDELSFIFTGFWAEVTASSQGPRYFYDLLVAPLFFLPTSWTVGWFENVVDVHTAIMRGAPKGEGGVTGGMPLDMLTMGYVQMGLPGVLVYAVMFGGLLFMLQRLTDSIEHPGIRAAFTAYVAVKIAGFAVFYAHPGHIIAGNYALIVTLILVGIFRRLLPSRALADARAPRPSRRNGPSMT